MSVSKDKKIKDKNKQWYFQIPNPLNHKKKKTHRGYPTKKAALMAECNLLEQLNEKPVEEKESKTFEDIMNLFLAHCEKKCSKGTVSNYKNYYNKHLQEFCGLKVEDITRLKVQEWFDDNIKIKKSPHIINGCRKLLKAAFNFALKMEIIEKNPFQFMEKAQEPVIIRNRFSIEELKKLLDICQKELPQFYLMFVLLNLAGVRSGELKALKKENITDVIKVFQQYYRGEVIKTKTPMSTRELEIGEFIQDAIKWHCTKYQIFRGYLFPSPIKKGYPISHKSVDRYFHELLRIAGYETGEDGEKHYMRVHDLRGEYADLMHANDVPLIVTSRNMGHSNTRTTEKHYSQVLPEAKKLAVKAIDNMFLENKGE